jgi:hypothetical protein
MLASWGVGEEERGRQDDQEFDARQS